MLTVLGFMGILLTPGWYRTRRNLYDGLIEGEEGTEAGPETAQRGILDEAPGQTEAGSQPP